MLLYILFIYSAPATVSVQRVKRVAVEVAEEGEGERGEGNKEQEGDVLPVSLSL